MCLIGAILCLDVFREDTDVGVSSGKPISQWADGRDKGIAKF